MAPAAVLSQPVEQLVGVGADATRALGTVGIHTVLDLGASALFGLAQRVASLADGDAGAASATPLPADMLDDTARGRTAAEVAAGELSQLRMLNTTQARALAGALAAPTVRDLGLWPPALAARRLVQLAMGSTESGADPAAPQELQPRMGQLPVDRVVYQQLYFECLLADAATAFWGELPQDGGVADAPVEGIDVKDHGWEKSRGEAGTGLVIEGLGGEPLDLSEAVLGRGFELPGLGLRVSVAQTWTPVGLSLGQLLHSVALAPGEATRVAMVDWSRRVANLTAEDITEDEVLSNTLVRNRAVGEITSSVAREMQEGRSNFSQTGASWGIGAGAAGSYKGVTAAVNFGYSRTDANGSAFSSSSGQRDVSASASQSVQDSTEQQASLSRGRRASIVSEVGTREQETLTTRVVANYNHMHALSVLYFEVVQLYRTRTEVVDVEPLLYLPVQPFDFGNESLVERYRGLLAEVALNRAARDALLGVVPPDASAGAARPPAPGVATLVLDGRMSAHPYVGDTPLDSAGLRLALGEHAMFERATLTLRLRSDEAALVEVQVSPVYSEEEKALGQAYESIKVQGIAGTGDLPVTTWAPVHQDRRWDPPEGYAPCPYRAVLGGDWGDLGSWTVLKAQRSTAIPGEAEFVIHFIFRRRDRQGQITGDPVRFRVERRLQAAETEQRLAVCQFQPDAKPKDMAPAPPPFDLAAHLRANALHYTMALLRRADPGMLGLVLGRLKLLGRPLLSQVDAVPVAHAGNYLVFRWRLLATTPEWQNLLKQRGLSPDQRLATARESLVPVGSGGVFAEAVLGRFNSAEKMDLTRFWNWQDSPIPLVPTEIAPLQAGIRQGADALLPGTLGAANLRQQDTPTVPDPGLALAGILGAVTKGDSFRDMAGLDKLLEQGGRAMSLSAQGAREFMAKAMESVSAYGARINHGRDMDDRTKKDGAEAAPAVGAGEGGKGSPAGGAGTGGSPGMGTGGGVAQPKPGAGKAATPPGPGSKEGQAFSGPAASPNEPAAEDTPDAPDATRVEQRFSVEVWTGLSADGSAQPGSLVSLDGELEIGRLPTDRSGLPQPDGSVFVPPDAASGIVRLDVRAGTGAITAVLAPEGADTLVPEVVLYIGRLHTLGFEWVGPRPPGVPTEFVRSFAEGWHAANPVPIATPVLPLSGAAIRLKITFEVVDSIALQRQHVLLAGESEFLDLARRSTSIAVGSLVDGTALDADRLRKLRELVAEALDVQAVRADLMATFNMLGTTRSYAPVLGCQLRYDDASQSIEARFPWAAVEGVRVVVG